MSVPVPSTPTNPDDRPGVDVAQHAMDQHPFVTPTRVLATSAVEALIRSGWQSPRMAAAPAVPATQDDLREQTVSALDEMVTEYIHPNEFGGYDVDHGALADVVLPIAAQHFAPVLEGLHAELDAAVIQRDKFGQLHLNEAKTHDETIRSLREAQAEIERLEQVAERATHLAGRVLSEFIQKGDPGGRLYYVIQAIRGETVMAWRQELAELSRPPVSDQTPGTPANSGEEDRERIADEIESFARVLTQQFMEEFPGYGFHSPTLEKLNDLREWAAEVRKGHNAAPSSVQGDTTPPHEVDLLRQAAKAAREHGNELRADVFEVAAKDHEDDDCPKGERAECMAVELARKALAEYATSAPSEGDHHA